MAVKIRLKRIGKKRTPHYRIVVMDARTKRRKDVPFCSLWKRVDEGISGVIDKTNFAELAREWRESKTTYVPNWEI